VDPLTSARRIDSYDDPDAWPLSGQPTPGSESSEVRWVPEAELPDYTMDRSMRINDFLARSGSPRIT
jgi:hypothetical protein